jgi:hypothetical protein
MTFMGQKNTPVELYSLLRLSSFLLCISVLIRLRPELLLKSPFSWEMLDSRMIAHR